MRYDANKIDAAVGRLVRLPLFASNRAADMQTFQFGAPRIVPSAFDGRGPRVVGDFALHVQCRWRLTDATHAVIASNERFDAIGHWLRGNPCTVQTVPADECGGLAITLTGGAILSVLPDDQPGEQWRLLQPGRDAPHFVLTSSGIEEA